MIHSCTRMATVGMTSAEYLAVIVETERLA